MPTDFPTLVSHYEGRIEIPSMRYLAVQDKGDPRKTDPTKLKTVIRHPIKRK